MYDLVVDPAASVDVTKESSRISGTEDYRSWQQLVTAHVRACDGDANSSPRPPTLSGHHRITISYPFGLSPDRGH